MTFFDLTTFLLTFLSREICPENIAVLFFLVQSLPSLTLSTDPPPKMFWWFWLPTTPTPPTQNL